MNPAKAAPSAPVKKAAREDPQILPGGLLILFFLLLAVGEAVQRHHNQHEKADDQQDTGHAGEHHGQCGHPGRKIKHKGTSVKSDALARRTLQNAKKEAWNRWIFKKYIDDPTRFASDFRVRSPARSTKVFQA